MLKQVFVGVMTFLSPNQQHQCTERSMDISFYGQQDAQPAIQPTAYPDSFLTSSSL